MRKEPLVRIDNVTLYGANTFSPDAMKSLLTIFMYSLDYVLLELVYGSSGGANSGASLIVATVGAGVGVAVTSWTNPASDEPKPPATRAPAERDVERPGTQGDDGQGQRDLADEGQATTPLDGAMRGDPPGCGARVRALVGRRRPLDGGRGRTWVGRAPRRVVIARIVARDADQRRVTWRGIGPLRCVVLWPGQCACLRVYAPSTRDGVQARDPRTGRPGGPAGRPGSATGRPAFGSDRSPGSRHRRLPADSSRHPGTSRPRRGPASACRTCAATSARTST